jgi:hypothetical protein
MRQRNRLFGRESWSLFRQASLACVGNLLIVNEHERLTLEIAVVKPALLKDAVLARLLASAAYAPQRCPAGTEF